MGREYTVFDRFFRLEASLLTWTLAGGAVGFGFWEFYTGVLLPTLLGISFGPIGLVQSSVDKLIGFRPEYAVAFALHAFTGIVAYSLAYSWVLRPVMQRLHWSIPAAVLGVATWIFALGIMAPFAFNAPFMLNFGNVSLLSGFGHLIMALIIGGVAERAFRQEDRFIAAGAGA